MPARSTCSIYDLQRFRDLRKSDDDFGFSSRSAREKPEPCRRSSPTSSATGRRCGIHTIVWCDSVNNLNRTFDRQAAGEFEIRVLFQMSANDSSTLIDSPAAGKLGENRALFFSEEEGRTEKFRPYGLPDEDWLDRARDQLHAKAKPAGYSDAPPLPRQPRDRRRRLRLARAAFVLVLVRPRPDQPPAHFQAGGPRLRR